MRMLEPSKRIAGLWTILLSIRLIKAGSTRLWLSLAQLIFTNLDEVRDVRRIEERNSSLVPDWYLKVSGHDVVPELRSYGFREVA